MRSGNVISRGIFQNRMTSLDLFFRKYKNLPQSLFCDYFLDMCKTLAQFLHIFVDKKLFHPFPYTSCDRSSFSYTWIIIKQPIHFVYCNLLFFFYQDPFGCCFLVIRWWGISCMLILQQQCFGVDPTVFFAFEGCFYWLL